MHFNGRPETLDASIVDGEKRVGGKSQLTRGTCGRSAVWNRVPETAKSVPQILLSCDGAGAGAIQSIELQTALHTTADFAIQRNSHECLESEGRVARMVIVGSAVTVTERQDVRKVGALI